MRPPDLLDRLSAVILHERRALVAVARRQGLLPEDAIECVQEALCTVLQLLARDEAPTGLGAYLTGVVRNLARNRRRTHHHARPHLPFETARGDVLAVRPEAEAWLERAEAHVRVQACVAQLCDTQRAVVTLRLLEERDGEDVAMTLGITRNHVDVLLHRAKHSLRACLVDAEAV